MASDSKKYYDANPDKKKEKNKYQSKYNKTKKAKLLIARAQRLRRKLGLKVGDKRDASHDNKNPRSNSGRAQLRSKNRNRYA
tara:strand:- start:198 stop:443 length:246 start_codon:yes stop_codon:yes gene_type:complete